MSGFVALRAAYAVTWVIALLYVRYLVVRYRAVSKEMKDLKRSA
ncbi:MAG: CcmD family protein [Candidatus Korobacteraceae bacterium]|jgi:CcmD family protein